MESKEEKEMSPKLTPKFRILIHAARMAAEASMSRPVPFKWTDSEREALLAFGTANGGNHERIVRDLDRAEVDEDFHTRLVTTIEACDDRVSSLADIA